MEEEEDDADDVDMFDVSEHCQQRLIETDVSSVHNIILYCFLRPAL